MKKKLSVLSVIIIMFSIQILYSQSKQDYEKLKNSMWNDPDFKTTEIPDKWKNESAVIMAKSYEYEVKKEVIFKNVHENIYLHKRIKILDKSAINSFSELSFENDRINYPLGNGYGYKEVNIGIKVIKPTGKENIVDLKEAVIQEIKEGNNKLEYKKIAIPDLEIGDILDYFYVIKNTYNVQSHIMEPVYYQLVEQYPIIIQKFNVRVLHRMYFNSRSINGAPELKPTDNEDETSYSFVDKNREKADVSLWSFPYRIYPTFKFQAFFIKDVDFNILGYLDFFLKDRKSITTGIDLNDISILIDKLVSPHAYINSYMADGALNYLKSNLDKNAPSDTIVKYAYYYLRQYARILREDNLIPTMSKILERKKIQHDLIVTVPNYVSDISDLILPNEVAFLIRIKGKPDYFIGDFSPLSLYRSIGSAYQGNNAYAISNPHSINNHTVEKIVIPVDKPEENSQFMKINMNFVDTKMDSLLVNIDKSIRGISREDEFGIIVTEIEYMDELYSIFKKEKEKEKEKEKTKKKTSKQLKGEVEKQQKKEQQKKDCLNELKNKYKNEFNAGDDFVIISSSLNQMGIWDNSPELKYSLSFKLGNLVKKMGSNYLISIGKLITQQLELSKKDIDRKVDIYAPYPRTFEYQINFEIPAGYKVKGLEKLNIKVVNETGGFIGKAEMQNNTIVISVKKYYVHIFEKVSEWPKMVQFIEAAYTYTQQNILLEKQ